MGNLAFDISKIVDLNKTVNLNIDKNVDVNVNIDDLLATAEADAEAFGTFALAEVDAYTFVNEGNGGMDVFEPGEIDVLGNSVDFLLSDDTMPVTLPGATGDLANTITINFQDDGPGNDTIPPDVDDVNGFGKLEPLTTPPQGNASGPPTPDGEIPDPLLDITDMVLNKIDGSQFLTDNNNVGAEYELGANWVVDFGTRTLNINGAGGSLPPTTADLLLTVPEGSDFIVEYLGLTAPGGPFIPPSGPIEIEFDAFDADNPGFFTFDGINYDVTAFVFEAESLQDADIADISDWAFEAIALFPQPGPGMGEAFAYAESTSAVDLNNDEVLATADVI